MSNIEKNVQELKVMLDNNEDFLLLDVRTKNEVLVSKISDKSIHIPMNDIPNRLGELDSNKEIIVYCKSGKRSAKVCEYLELNNYTKLEVELLSGQESFRIKSFVKSNVWAVLPNGKSSFKKGQIIDCFLHNHSNKTLA